MGSLPSVSIALCGVTQHTHATLAVWHAANIESKDKTELQLAQAQLLSRDESPD
jgi:hypothetical protein